MKYSNLLRRALVASIFPAAALVLAPSQSHAQAYPCGSPGPGEQIVGMTQGGNGVASLPLCQRVGGGDSGDSSDGGYSPKPSRPYDPEQARLQAAVAGAVSNVTALYENIQRIAKLKSDPRYKLYQAGFWQQFQARRDAPPGEYCAAMFASLKGTVGITGPGGGFKGALLVFSGADIPTPETIQTIRVTLDQDDGAPATVSAFNYSGPGQEVGFIAFWVPTIKAAVDGMLDKQRFRLSLNGKQLADISWHSGLVAKSGLNQCLSKRS